ncbi:MAG: hypothetical protein AAF494_13775 [Pseudomonadota bacterium]
MIRIEALNGRGKEAIGWTITQKLSADFCSIVVGQIGDLKLSDRV